MAASATSPSPAFQIQHIERKIRIYHSDRAFLQKTWRAIHTYAKAVDANMQDLESEIHVNVNLKKYIDITNILPKPLQVWFGEYPLMGMHVNCHGAALVAAGVFPGMTYLDSPESLPGCTLKELDSKQKPAPGDIIFYDTTPKIFSHSCVCISDELCFNMDGFNTSLTIQNLSEVDASLRKKGISLNVRLFRKVEDWSVPSNLEKAYDLKTNKEQLQELYQQIALEHPDQKESWQAAASTLNIF